MTAVPSRGSSTHRRAVALCRGRAGPASALLAVVALSGCGGGLNGTYTPSGDGFFEQLTFQSGGTVEITWMGMTKEGSYEVDGDRVKVTVGGDTQVLRIDGRGCVDGGGLIGRYCKGGSSVVQSDARSGGRSKSLAGTWETETPMGTLTLEFRRGNEVRVSVAGAGGEPERREGSYESNGDRVIVRLPEEEPLELVRQGDVLEGPASFAGTVIRFRRK